MECAGCGEGVAGEEEFLQVDERVFHQRCFVCARCSKDLGTEPYVETGGQFYCYSHFAGNCDVCQKPLNGAFCSVGGKTLHPQCFKCHDCGERISRQSRSVKFRSDGSYLCESCVARRRATRDSRQGGGAGQRDSSTLRRSTPPDAVEDTPAAVGTGAMATAAEATPPTSNASAGPSAPRSTASRTSERLGMEELAALQLPRVCSRCEEPVERDFLVANDWFDVEAVADFTAACEFELSIHAGELLQARYHSRGGSWMKAISHETLEQGLIPTSFVQIVRQKFWHRECFACVECGKLLGSTPFLVRPTGVTCADHVQGVLCAGCGISIIGSSVVVDGSHFHTHCVDGGDELLDVASSSERGSNDGGGGAGPSTSTGSGRSITSGRLSRWIKRRSEGTSNQPRQQQQGSQPGATISDPVLVGGEDGLSEKARAYLKMNIFMNLDAKVLAQNLCVFDHAAFGRIARSELEDGNFNRENRRTLSPNVSAVVDRFNHTSRWIVFEILGRECNAEERAGVIKHFVVLALACTVNKNFNAAMVILAGLQSFEVYRLKEVWSLLDDRARSAMDRLVELFSIHGNFKFIRQELATALEEGQPCVPHLGMYLADLTSLHNQRRMENIDQDKRFAKVERTMDEIARLQAVPYAFETDPVCDHFLSHLYTMSLEESYARSLEIQPKERKGGGKAKKKKKKGK